MRCGTLSPPRAAGGKGSSSVLPSEVSTRSGSNSSSLVKRSSFTISDRKRTRTRSTVGKAVPQAHADWNCSKSIVSLKRQNPRPRFVSSPIARSDPKLESVLEKSSSFIVSSPLTTTVSPSKGRANSRRNNAATFNRMREASSGASSSFRTYEKRFSTCFWKYCRARSSASGAGAKSRFNLAHSSARDKKSASTCRGSRSVMEKLP